MKKQATPFTTINKYVVTANTTNCLPRKRELYAAVKPRPFNMVFLAFIACMTLFSKSAMAIAGLPSIAGTTTVCVSATTALTDAVTGGTWSSSNATIASVGATTGVVTGVAAGTANITYTQGGLNTSITITVNAKPGPIQGASSECVGITTLLTDAVTGGTWSTLSTNVTVDAPSGNVTGASAGSGTITYTLPSGCSTTYPNTVYANPAAITGITTTCVGGTTTLTDATTGTLSWSSSSTSVATVSGGTVTGISAGSVIITYKILTGSCYTTTLVTVQSASPSISGNSSTICVGNTVTLSDASGTGAWNSSNTAVATVGSSSGIVTGIVGGTAKISYSPAGTSGCITSTIVSVNTVAAISGANVVCANATLSLSDATAGGTWSSSNIAVGTVSTSGIVTGISGGTTIITYTAPSTCIVTKMITVTALPTTILGNNTVCTGSTTTLSDLTTGGTWTSSVTSHATVGTSGIVTGVAAGTSNITYTASGCYITTPVTVNTQPGAILGTKVLCAASTVSLSDAAAGGTWSSSNPAVGTISASGVVAGITAGTTTIMYAMSSGCTVSTVVTVNTVPAAITGTGGVCVGSTITLIDTVTGGTWSSSTATVGTIGATSGIMTGIASGTTSITYTMAAGCIVRTTVTVNSHPATITGAASVCAGSTTSLSDATTGGTWSSSNTATGTVSTSGVVTGIAAGTSTITYTGTNTCTTSSIVTVNAIPSAIQGTLTACAGATTTLADTTTGGKWSTGNPAIATVGSSSGIVSAVTAGSVNITYTTIATGCNTFITVTVNPNPLPVQGSSSICVGITTTLADSTTGGTWISSIPTNGSVDVSGNVTGIAAGTATISYILSSTGCYVTYPMTIKANPSAIFGITTTCVGGTTVLTDTTASALSYTSSNTSMATIDNTGTLTGIAAGTATITYKITTGCYTTTTVTVNTATPGILNASPAICPGVSRVLFEPGAGAWSSSNTATGTISTDGLVTGIAGGTTTISFIPTGTSGCVATVIVTVTPATPITGLGKVCMGSTITLSDVTTGGSWISGSGNANVDISSGIVTPVSAGTATISYITGTGCTAAKTITINAVPSAIYGADTVCANGTTALVDTTVGGSWTSGSTSVATVASSGTVTGVAAGNVNISYTLTTGCSAIAMVTVNAAPTVSLSGTACGGSVLTLTSSTNYDSVVWKNSGTTVKVTIPTTGPGGADTVSIGTSDLLSPTATFLATNGDLYVSDFNHSRVLKYPAGYNASTSGVIVAQNGISANPYGIVLDASGNLYVSTNEGDIIKYPAGSNASTAPTFSTNMGGNIGDLAMDASGNLFAAISYYSGPSFILELPANFTATTTATVVVPRTGRALGMCLHNDTIYVTNNDSFAITKFSPLGGYGMYDTTGVIVAGGNDSGSANNQFAGPFGVAVDNAGNIYASDFVNNTVLKFPAGSTRATNGTVVAGFGFTGSGTMGLNQPGHLNVDASGNLYIADGGNNRIQIYYSGLGSGPSNTDTLTAGASGSYTAKVTGINGCTATTSATNVRTTGAITGTTTLCQGTTTTLADTTAGGTWQSLSPGTASVGTSGIVTGTSAGSAVINYTAHGCMVSTTVVVNPLANAGSIAGPSSVAIGSSISLTDGAASGSWSSTNSAAGTVDGGGNVTGIAIGTTTISYTVTNGCGTVAATQAVTVTGAPLPSITGTASVCIGYTTTLSNTTTGGIWTSANAGIATVVGSTGVVTGVGAGTVNITYAQGGATTSITVTVNANPLPVQGAASECLGTTIALADSTSGGVWSNSVSANGTVDASGNVTGLTVGNTTITYTLPSTGCYVTYPNTVKANPSSIFGTTTLCAGSTTTLFDTTANALSWTSSNTTVATVDNSATVTGLIAGTATITYKVLSGCTTTTTVTVTAPTPGITGNSAICPGTSASLTDASGTGLWTSSNTAVGTVGTDGTVTGIAGGTAKITYTPAGTSGCTTTTIVTVNTVPAITGPGAVCIGATITLSDASVGGNWLTVSATASVDAVTGIVTPISAGTAIISYYTATGCLATKTITVNTLPSAIYGIDTVCANATTALADTTGTGSWTSGSTSVATVASTGTVTGVSAGVANITYTVAGTGCTATTSVTVNAAPIVSLSGSACSGSLLTMTGSTNYDSVVWKNNGTEVKVTIPGVSPSGIVSIGIADSIIPIGTFITSGGDLYVIDGTYTHPRVLKYPAGFNASTSGIIVAKNGLSIPYSVSVDGAGYIYVSNDTEVIKYPPSSDSTTIGTVVVRNGVTGLVYDVAVDAAGNIFVPNTNDGTILEYAPGSDSTTSPGAVISLLGVSNTLYGVHLVNDTIYAAEGQNNSIQMLTPTGTFGVYNTPVIIAGGNGTGNGANQFNGPLSVGTDNAGNVYVCDNGNNRVQEFPRGSTSATNGITVAGTGVGADTLNTPQYTSVDASGNLYIADFGNNRVQVYYRGSGGPSNTDTLTASSSGSYVAKVTGINGCTATTNAINVRTTGTITGTTTICQGTSATLADTTIGGTWQSMSPGTATVNAAGLVNGVSAGTAVINYTAHGCVASVTVVVNPLANAGTITGTSTVNTGSSISLTDAASGGTWSSTNIAAGTVDVSGNVTGIAAGTTTISYAVTNGCGTAAATKVITVTNPALPAITGTASVCIGFTTALTDATTGGTWTSANGAIATVVGSTGVVTGTGAGTVNITYTSGGSTATINVTVNANPLPIQGTASECVGATIALADSTSGGVWTNSVSANGTVDASGNVTGVTAGNTTITYTLPSTGCYATYPNTTKANPSAIYGITTLCAGGTTTLFDTTTNTISWTSSNTLAATIDNSGTVTGVGAGTTTITYKVLSGCITTTTVTVNTTTPITGGTSAICPGIPTALGESGSGAWNSSNTAVATINSDGFVTGNAIGGTARISYTPTGTSGCVATTVITVNTAPAISGATTLCSNATITLSNAVTGGAWISGNTSAATIGSSTGVVTGAGAGITNIAYLTPTGCIVTVNVTVTAAPTAILNNVAVCTGSSIALSDATAGGIWSSNASSHVSVDGSGNITGAGVGTATISYAMSGCYVTVIATDNATPSAITGTLSVCSGATTALSDASAGGVWSSTAGATIGTSGIVTGGGSAATATISYTFASTGCAASAVVTVNALPTAILGNAATCIGSTVTLTDAASGGTWTSSNNLVASIGSASGTLTGVAGGTATITYTNGGCRTTATATVNAAIGSINGASAVCQGYSTTLTDATTGGTWLSTNTAAGTISAGGIVTGVATGTTTISYTASSGCVRTTVITVNPTPTSINGTTALCANGSSTLTDGVAGGTWSITGIVATIGGTTGVITASSSYTGTATVSYTAAGCAATVIVSVNAKPTPVQGVTSECAGVTIPLSDLTAGGTWSATGNVTIGSSTGVVTAGASAGTGSITYTMPTGCFATYPNTVNANPAGITGTFNVCVGTSVNLTDATSGSIGWSSSNTTVATTINSGTITGVAAGTATITYKILTGSCFATQVITVNAYPTVAAISAPSSISNSGGAVSISETTAGGVWSSSNSGVIALSGTTGLSILATAVTTSGSSVISYAVSNAGCITTVTKTISASPAPPHHGGSTTTGISATIYAGSSVTLTDAEGGIWTSSDDGTATVDENGTVTGIIPGTANITHTITNEQGNVTTNVTPVVIAVKPVSISLLPNPNKGIFMVKGTLGSVADEEVTLEVTNVLGQVIYKNKVMAYGGKINETVSLNNGLINGMYLLDVNSRTEHNVFHFVIEQ